jgi:small subunit ribosomal protein S21
LQKEIFHERRKLSSLSYGYVVMASEFFGGFMTGVRIKENESFESALKRFKKQCEKAGILSEIKKREHYEKPSVRRKKKALAARKKALKRARLASR